MKKILILILLISAFSSSSAQRVLMNGWKYSGSFSPSGTDTIQVSLRDSLNASGTGFTTGYTRAATDPERFWNTWAPIDGTLVSQYFKYVDGTQSGVRAQWGGGGPTGFADNTVSYGTTGNTTSFPNGVFRIAAFVAGGPTTTTFTIKNIPAGTWKLEALGSRNTGTSRLQTYTISGGTGNGQLDAATQLTTLHTITGIVSAGGVDKTFTITYDTNAYLNGFRLIKTA